MLNGEIPGEQQECDRGQQNEVEDHEAQEFSQHDLTDTNRRRAQQFHRTRLLLPVDGAHSK